MLLTTDALVVGAGPAGLFALFQLGLLEVQAHLVDALPYPGGQCIELYPDKPIYDIPALPSCTGRELVARLLEQIAPFKTPMHLGQQVSAITPQSPQGWLVETSAQRSFLAQTVLIAGGVGAFQPRELAIPGLAPFKGSQLHYQVPTTGQALGRHVLILGGGDSALRCAITLAQTRPESHITLVHRRDVFETNAVQGEQLHALIDQQRLHIATGQITGFDQGPDHTLKNLHLTTPQGHTQPLPADTVIALLGLAPKLGPLAQWGLNLNRRQIIVTQDTFETNLQGIFAVGDINTYPGKKKLILCGFHEATLAAFAIAQKVFPTQHPAPLQYTTTSQKLQQRLGRSTRAFSG